MAEESLSPDEQLEVAVQLLDRDRAGLFRLMAAYGPGVKAWLKRKYHGLLTEHDVTVVLFLAGRRAVEKADKFDDKKGTLGKWFSTLALNCARDMLREERPQPTVPLVSDPPAPEAEEDCEPRDPTDPVFKDLLDCMEGLGDMQRTIAKADQLANGQADAVKLAQKLGIPKQHVYSYRNKYLKTLLNCMNKRGHTAETIVRRR